MPELPEVEVIRRALAPHLEGRRIVRAELTERRLTRRDGGFATLARAVTGRTIRAVRRRGKHLLLVLGERALVIRLGMTGQLLWADCEAGLPCDRHVHARLLLEGGGALAYRDIRKFGEMFLLPAAELDTRLRLGIEPLVPGFTVDALRALCRRSTKIKPLLLDQRRVAGIGNIYADEALFRAGIRPTRPASSLRADELTALREAIRDVLKAGIRHRGSSIANFCDPHGRPGRFAERHQVYRKQGQRCPRCGVTIARILLGQRGTHFCPGCQA